MHSLAFHFTCCASTTMNHRHVSSGQYTLWNHGYKETLTRILASVVHFGRSYRDLCRAQTYFNSRSFVSTFDVSKRGGGLRIREHLRPSHDAAITGLDSHTLLSGSSLYVDRMHRLALISYLSEKNLISREKNPSCMHATTQEM